MIELRGLGGGGEGGGGKKFTMQVTAVELTF